jgi:hypothetical protein
MSFNGEDQNKPPGILCRRAALIKWTGLTECEIADLEALKILKSIRFKKKNGKLGRRLYDVEQVEKMIQGK